MYVSACNIQPFTSAHVDLFPSTVVLRIKPFTLNLRSKLLILYSRCLSSN